MQEKLTDQWATPIDFYSWANQEYGPFDLDVCASKENHKCSFYFTIQDNALECQWNAERVWCNPPYSDPLPWVRKAIKETNEGRCEEVVMLLKNDCSTKWFREAYDGGTIVFLAPRIQFVLPQEALEIRKKEGKKINSNNFSSILVLFGRRSDWGIYFKQWR